MRAGELSVFAGKRLPVWVVVAGGLCGVLEEVRGQDRAEEDGALKAVAGRYQEARRAMLRRRFALYADGLSALEKRLGETGRAEEAAAAAAERMRVMRVLEAKPEPEPPEGIPAGPTPDELLEALAATLQPEEVPDDVVAGGGAGGQARTRVLKIEKAEIDRNSLPSGGGGIGRGYWGEEKAAAAWTVSGLVPGEYAVILRFQCGPGGGGVAKVKAGREEFTVEVPEGESWTRRGVLQVGTVKVTGSGLDLKVVAESLAEEKNGSLWDLRAVMLEPVAAAGR
ncbi:MAG: hypothetical protein DVB22_002186 [Verrucomicrobia bacterium]|nr:MAG: hypothetical protein DVB22_002186 [Verrucomicrobiota bacterium]